MKYILISIFIMFGSRSYAGGNTVGNGGDSVAEEFVAAARNALSLLFCQNLDPELERIVETLQTNLNITQVNTSDTGLWLEGQEVDAINFQFKHQILISRIRWAALRMQPVSNRVTLVLHEYLGVSGFNDSRYEISQKLVSRIVNKLNENSISLQKFLDMMSTFLSKLAMLRRDLVSSDGKPKKPSISLQDFCLDTGAIGTYVENINQIILDNPEWFEGRKAAAYNTTDFLTGLSADLTRQCYNQKINYVKTAKDADRAISYIEDIYSGF